MFRSELQTGSSGAAVGSWGLGGLRGQLGLDLRFATTQEDRADALAEAIEILVVVGPAFVVERVGVAVEAEMRTEPCRVEKANDRMQLVDPALDRRAEKPCWTRGKGKSEADRRQAWFSCNRHRPCRVLSLADSVA
jgi:hypothetical protein